MSIISRKNSRPTHVTLSSAALVHNLKRVKDMVGNTTIMAVVKADAYGHSMELAAKSLIAADEFAVSSLDDVMRLRAISIDHPITILSANLALQDLNNFGDASKAMHNLRYTVFDHTQLDTLQRSQPKEAISIWLKVDTGMGRLGFQPEEVSAVLSRLNAMKSVAKVNLMTHLANADRPYRKANYLQLGKFQNLFSENQFSQASVLNSAGVCAFSEHSFDVVRPGLMLYGVSPLAETSSEDLELKPVMEFFSELIAVKTVPAGSSIGYGSTHRVQLDTVVGVVACGYGDGYPRHAIDGTPVLVAGQKAQLIGRVSMDMITVNLNNIDAKVGDEVLLWGEKLPIEEVARHASCIAYEMTCRIPNRVERVFV